MDQLDRTDHDNQLWIGDRPAACAIEAAATSGRGPFERVFSRNRLARHKQINK